MGLSDFLRNLLGESYRRWPKNLNQRHSDLLQREADLRKRETRLNEKENHLQHKQQHQENKISRAEDDLEERYREIRLQLECIAKEKSIGFPWLARAYADYFHLIDRKRASRLETKKRPARQTAREIKRDIAKKRRKAEEKWRILRARVDYYETLFPWLTDYVDEDIDDLIGYVLEDRNVEPEADDSSDSVRKWISEVEYRKLSTAERNQKALERYLGSRKPRWKIGRDYERYVGYAWEQKGYSVKYFGIEQGFCDLGRDLIARNDEHTQIIQCKMWSRHKTIREKHLFQLYGSTVKYRIQAECEPEAKQMSMFESRPSSQVRPVFVTTTKLSDMARRVARALGIEVFEDFEYDRSYPMIKCNIAQGSEEKIYHLPFDQQYDKVIIEPERGERYVETAQEAEELGFRRAYRWRGDK
jgi:hypothetical protein